MSRTTLTAIKKYEKELKRQGGRASTSIGPSATNLMTSAQKAQHASQVLNEQRKELSAEIKSINSEIAKLQKKANKFLSRENFLEWQEKLLLNQTRFFNERDAIKMQEEARLRQGKTRATVLANVNPEKGPNGKNRELQRPKISITTPQGVLLDLSFLKKIKREGSGKWNGELWSVLNNTNTPQSFNLTDNIKNINHITIFPRSAKNFYGLIHFTKKNGQHIGIGPNHWTTPMSLGIEKKNWNKITKQIGNERKNEFKKLYIYNEMRKINRRTEELAQGKKFETIPVKYKKHNRHNDIWLKTKTAKNKLQNKLEQKQKLLTKQKKQKEKQEKKQKQQSRRGSSSSRR